jgi:hypothetical protein
MMDLLNMDELNLNMIFKFNFRRDSKMVARGRKQKASLL